MKLETERLILRPWEESDAESLYEYAKEPAVGPIAGWPVHTSVENSREIIRTVLSAPETYAVCLKEDNKAIGSVGLIPPMQSHTKAADTEIEIGYWIGVPFWGKGYIPEAVRELQHRVFVDLGYSAIWCGYYDGNTKSKRCQEKCGFIYHHTELDKPCDLMNDVRTEHFTKITKEQWEQNNTKKQKAVLYIHGKGGNAEEADFYKKFFPDSDVIGLDYKTNTPWETKTEIQEKIEQIQKTHSKIILLASSIGAFFGMNAKIQDKIAEAYFISPIVDMEKLISNMMIWADVTEKELQEKQIIEVDFGEPLSWEYLMYVRKNPIDWNVPTEILYGENDNLTDIKTITDFAKTHNSNLTIMKNGEHWFHTDEQIAFLDNWIKAAQTTKRLSATC